MCHVVANKQLCVFDLAKYTQLQSTNTNKLQSELEAKELDTDAKQTKDNEQQSHDNNDEMKCISTNQANNDNDSDNKMLLNTISSDLKEPTSRVTKISQDKTNNNCNDNNTNSNYQYVKNDF